MEIRIVNKQYSIISDISEINRIRKVTKIKRPVNHKIYRPFFVLLLSKIILNHNRKGANSVIIEQFESNYAQRVISNLKLFFNAFFLNFHIIPNNLFRNLRVCSFFSSYQSANCTCIIQ